MEIKGLMIISLLLMALLIMPTGFASDDISNLTVASDEVMQIEEGNISYFNDDNGNIEEPLLDDDFASLDGRAAAPSASFRKSDRVITFSSWFCLAEDDHQRVGEYLSL